MPKAQLTRRELLGSVAAGGAGLAVAASGMTTARSAVTGDLLSGDVVEVEAPDALFVGPVEGTGDEIKEIRFTPATTFWRDGTASLEDFRQGDEVIAEGAWEPSGVFRATRVEILGRTLDAEVLGRNGSVLSTDSGDVVIIEETEPQDGPGLRGKQLSRIARGDVIFAYGRMEPDGRLVAYRIGVAE